MGEYNRWSGLHSPRTSSSSSYQVAVFPQSHLRREGPGEDGGSRRSRTDPSLFGGFAPPPIYEGGVVPEGKVSTEEIVKGKSSGSPLLCVCGPPPTSRGPSVATITSLSAGLESMRPRVSRRGVGMCTGSRDLWRGPSMLARGRERLYLV